MFAIAKIAGLSAVLSAGLVTAYDLPRETAPISGKQFLDRVPQFDGEIESRVRVAYASAAQVETTAAGIGESKGNKLPVVPGDQCAAQAWPNISPECLVASDGTPARKVVRTITIEQRDIKNTSTLVRVPAEIARR